MCGWLLKPPFAVLLQDRPVPKPLQAPLSFVQVSGREVPAGASKSNPQEAETVQKLVREILQGKQVGAQIWSRRSTTPQSLPQFVILYPREGTVICLSTFHLLLALLCNGLLVVSSIFHVITLRVYTCTVRRYIRYIRHCCMLSLVFIKLQWICPRAAYC